jgi:hypothetical protein
VLQPVVGQDHVAARILLEQDACRRDAIARDHDRKASARKQQRLVADPAGIVVRLDRHGLAVFVIATVAAAHNPRPVAALGERCRERSHERRPCRCLPP